MVSPAESSVVEVAGLCVRVQRQVEVASLRYFDAAERFVATVCEALGTPLPATSSALRVEASPSGGRFILLWRSPTETLLLSYDPLAFAELEARAAPEVDGCMVVQTGGIRVLRVAGPKARDLLLRLGSATAIPALGEACSGRLAELQVLTACLQAGEYHLLVERVYADHLLEWIRATVADF
ncbi:MAG: sarcosine oxidase subunit gamma family protein [Steroidobacteraceae bacterium]